MVPVVFKTYNLNRGVNLIKVQSMCACKYYNETPFVHLIYTDK
jgi:hypothetical protein